MLVSIVGDSVEGTEGEYVLGDVDGSPVDIVGFDVEGVNVDGDIETVGAFDGA